VFGVFETGTDLIDNITDLPVYANSPGETLKPSVYNEQKTFFRDLARGIGDERVVKVYEGKIPRKVEVVKCRRVVEAAINCFSPVRSCCYVHPYSHYDTSAYSQTRSYTDRTPAPQPRFS